MRPLDTKLDEMTKTFMNQTCSSRSRRLHALIAAALALTVLPACTAGQDLGDRGGNGDVRDAGGMPGQDQEDGSWMESVVTGGDGGPGTPVLRPDAPTSRVPPGAKRFFVTAKEVAGSMGGVEGANTLCNDAAEGALLKGNWVALFAGAPDVKDVGPWYLMDGQKVFNNRANLTSGLPLLDEFGLDEHGQGIYGRAWTRIVGACAVSPEFYDARLGSRSAWLLENYDLGCPQRAHVYCIEQ